MAQSRVDLGQPRDSVEVNFLVVFLVVFQVVEKVDFQEGADEVFRDLVEVVVVCQDLVVVDFQELDFLAVVVEA